MQDIYKLIAEDNRLSLATVIESAIAKLGMSQRQLCSAIGIQRKTLDRILNGEAQKVDFLLLLKLCMFLELDINELAQYMTAGLPSEEIGELEMARKAGFIMRTFDITGLQKAGIISTTTDFHEIESRIKRLYGLESIFQYKSEFHAPLFSRTKRGAHSKMLEFWVTTAFQQARLIKNPHPYNYELLVKLIPKIRAYTLDERDGLLNVARMLYVAGVTVFVQSYLPKIQIRGATFMVNRKPCIVLTNYKKKLDTVWFALMHEIYHVLRHIEHIEYGYHVTSDLFPDLFINENYEREADEFAREFLLSEDKRSYISTVIDLEDVVREYAQKWNIHPAIIYGQFAYEQQETINYAKFEAKRPQSDNLVNRLRAINWHDVSLEEIAQGIRQELEPETQLTAEPII